MDIENLRMMELSSKTMLQKRSWLESSEKSLAPVNLEEISPALISALLRGQKHSTGFFLEAGFCEGLPESLRDRLEAMSRAWKRD
jgi:hypothetical protein